MFCENCGTQLGDNERFCMKCGHPVSGGNELEMKEQETITAETGKAGKVKIVIGMAVALGVTAIGIAIVMGLGANKKDKADVNLIEQTAEEETFFNAEAKEQQENSQTDIISVSKDMKFTFPENFESWETTSRNLAGEKRYLYADGHKITMPTTIGEWEELLSTKFVKIPEFFAGGSTNYTLNKVCVIDENGIEYVFGIDTACYEPIEDDLEAELIQLRQTSVIGLDIHWEDGGRTGINSKLGSYISLIPQGSMFEGNVEEIKNNLCEEYGLESIDGNTIEVDCFQDGYKFAWGLADDGKNGSLFIDYVPDNFLAYQKFFDGTMSVGDLKRDLKDIANYNSIGVSLIDVTNDGIAELILWNNETEEGNPNHQHDILTYNQDTGTLDIINYHGSEVIGNNGVLVDIQSYYRDGTYKNYKDDFADYNSYQCFVYDQYGTKIKLVDLKYSNCHGECFINNKRVSVETYEECSKMYSASDAIIEEPNSGNITKFLKQTMSIYYVEREDYQEKQINNSGLKVYDDSLIPETETGLEYWQENYLSLLQQFFNQEGYLEDEYAAWGYEPLAPKENQLTFNVKDINNDGLPELFLAPYTEEQYLINPNLFIPKETWEDSMLGAITGIGFPMGEIVVHIPNMDTDIGVYTYDGNSLSLVKEFYCVGEADGQEIRYYILENGLTREISQNEFDSLVHTYEINDYNRIEKRNLTIDNLEEALGIKIHYFGSEYMIEGKNVLVPAVCSVQETIDQPLAVSAEAAYEEFLAGNRNAIVDSKYGTGQGNQIALLKGERVSLSEITRRVLDVCNQTYGRESQDSSIDSIQYSYIDCGSDGKPELVIRFQGLDYYDMEDDSNCICVLKYRDGQLYITYSSLNWARNYSTLYKNGVILSEGSVGAEIFYSGMEVLDNNGIRRNIYSSTNSMDLYGYNANAYEAVLANTSAISMNILVYNVNGGIYRTAEFYNEDNLNDSQEKELAQQYLDKCAEDGENFVELDIIEQKINKLKERYNISDNITGEEIVWQNLK